MAILPVARAKCGCALEPTESGRMIIPAEPRSMSLASRVERLKGVNQSTSEPAGLNFRTDSEKLVVPSYEPLPVVTYRLPPASAAGPAPPSQMEAPLQPTVGFEVENTNFWASVAESYPQNQLYQSQMTPRDPNPIQIAQFDSSSAGRLKWRSQTKYAAE